MGKTYLVSIGTLYLDVIFKKYKTFSVFIYSYINTNRNWKNEISCGNTTSAGRI